MRPRLPFLRASLFLCALAFVPVVLSIIYPVISEAKTETQLALNWKPEPQFGGFYAAESGGHFASRDLAVRILPGGAGTPVVQMVAAKKVEFGIASADEVVIARSRGADVVALFATYQTNPQGIMVHVQSGLNSLKDLYSRADVVLAVQRGLPYAMFLEKKFRPVRAKTVPYQGGIGLFMADKKFAQQCFVTSEPVAAAKAGAKLKTFLIADEGYNPYTTVLITHGEMIQKHPHVVEAMIEASRAGWLEYLKSPQATNAKMQALNPSMDLQTFRESAEAQKPLIQTSETVASGLGSMSEDRWVRLVEQLHDLGVISSRPDTKSIYWKPRP
ncbi:MAG: ABC transporter substrate-binding protein [Bdellovibrionaceae bacterium]|nr:ABC transporter substrate-binding protein [Pseudobdellovibrionaceae bacterium]